METYRIIKKNLKKKKEEGYSCRMAGFVKKRKRNSRVVEGQALLKKKEEGQSCRRAGFL